MTLLENFGFLAVIIMVVSYALEDKSPFFVMFFAIGCALAAVYALIIKAYPFLVAEAVWTLIALRRWQKAKSQHQPS